MNNEVKKLHLTTVKKHRKIVRKLCFKMGIPIQGILHDLSKYSKEEMSICQFATGKKSPHDVAREKLGYSPSWRHHAIKNPHHWEHWLDIGPMKNGHLQIVPVKMPYKYVIEMFCDMVGASKTYGGDCWSPKDVWDYWTNKRKCEVLMHPDSIYLLEKLFWNLYQFGEKMFYKRYRKHFKKYFHESYDNGTIQNEVWWYPLDEVNTADPLFLKNLGACNDAKEEDMSRIPDNWDEMSLDERGAWLDRAKEKKGSK